MIGCRDLDTVRDPPDFKGEEEVLPLTRGMMFAAFVFGWLSGASAFASGLCATVMDYARLPLPAASLNVRSLMTGKSYVAKTDKSGSACLPELPEGLYSVEASLVGFLHVRYYPVRLIAAEKVALSFSLPFGDLTEGGFSEESTLSGTLLKGGSPVESAQVCITETSGGSRTCTVTNDLGEYALIGPAGTYTTEIRTRDGKIYKSKIDMSVQDIYRNRLSVDANAQKR
ncbi:MAG TPA: carboxypeptidase-like regulatory domain-containing protein [Bryobacteraceae bacterium]|nr:carboxypeptidase-like regulatory domain-containing protein [Bryobacteraceae bacterium]